MSATTTSTNRSTRMVLAPVSNSCLNITSNLGSVRRPLKMRSPSKKRQRISEFDFFSPPNKKLHIDTSKLQKLQRATTAIIGESDEASSSPVDAAAKLKLRLRLAYYKLRTNQTALPVSKLDNIAKTKSLSSQRDQKYNRNHITSTPLPLSLTSRFSASTPLVTRSLDSYLLDASTSTPRINSFTDNNCSSLKASVLSELDCANTSKISSTSTSNLSFKSGINLSEYLRTKSALDIGNTSLKLYSFKHIVPKSVKSLTLPLTNNKVEGTPQSVKREEEQSIHDKSKDMDETEKLPSITIDDTSIVTTNSTKQRYTLPSINNLLNSTPTSKSKFDIKVTTTTKSQFSITNNSTNNNTVLSIQKISVTPVRKRMPTTATEILMSSPTKMVSTPSSMGAARSLLQLALN